MFFPAWGEQGNFESPHNILEIIILNNVYPRKSKITISSYSCDKNAGETLLGKLFQQNGWKD